MIEIKTIGVWGFEGSLRGCRMPYESFDKSDSGWVADCSCSCPYFSNMECDSNLVDKDSLCPTKYYGIGEADMKLAKKLIKGGSEHRKFLRMIHVQAEVKAPRYWILELATYKIGTTMNSSSTMHLLTKRHLTADDFSNCLDRVVMQDLIAEINELIDIYNDKTLCEYDRDEYFMEIKRLLPESFMQKFVFDCNYECLLNIYHQRKNHRLQEWRKFSDWILGLPYMKEFLEAMV